MKRYGKKIEELASKLAAVQALHESRMLDEDLKPKTELDAQPEP